VMTPRCGCLIQVDGASIGYSILLNIPIINYHPMVLLPSIASSCSSNIADLFTKPISRHRFDTLIGDAPAIVASTTSVISTPSVATATVVASAPTATTVSDSVPSLHPNLTLPILDTGDSVSTSPSRSDFTLEVSQASYGLIRSAFDTSVASDSVASDTKAYSKVDSIPVDPFTLITGEDVSVDPVDLSSPDTTTIDSDSESTKVSFDILEFGTASLTFIYSKSTSELLRVFVEPTQIDWIHWVPLPRLTPTESYFHICGRDYLQAFALFHLIPIWIALVSALLRSE